MHVYLKNGTQRKWLIVQLDEGHAPRIAGFPVNEAYEVSSTLEPAIWFKLMVLDSVSIDCEKHVVCWTNISADEDEDSQGKEHLMFTDEDQYCYDFDDDLDELFNLALYLINTNPMAELNMQRRCDLVQEYQRSLFRLLHCYILGKVELHPEDTRQVLQAREMQLKSISQADEEVMMHKRISEQYSNQMREIRNNEILPVYDEIVSQSLYHNNFMQILKYDVLNDLEKVKDEVDMLQKRVDKIKLAINEGTANKLTKESLAIAKSKRDVAVRTLTQLLEWREMIFEQEKQKTKKPQQQPLAPVITKYMDLHEKKQKEKALTLGVFQKKVRAVSVRECIENTLNDLEKGQTTVGDEMSVDGKKATNVITAEGCNSEWQTLNERLATIVHNSEHPVGKRFSKFTEQIRDRCSEIFRAYERLSDKNAIAEIDGYLIVGSDECPFDEDILNDMKETIHEHFRQLTCLFMEIFQKQSQLFWRKLWLCYEKCFFHHVGDHLIRLYRLVNSRAMIDLEKRVARLRDFPVCKLGLQMKDEWWLSLFEPIGGPELSRITKSNSTKHALKYSSDVEINNTDSYDNECYIDETRNVDQRCQNIDAMRETLQVGTAKVLLRSRSCYDVGDGGTKFDPVRDGSHAMVQDISSKVIGAKNFISFNRIFHHDESNNAPGNLDFKSNTGTEQRSRSRSCNDILSCESVYEHDIKRTRLSTKRKDTFERHFGSVLSGFRDVFSMPSPLKKMQCLTASLRIMARNVMELRQKKFASTGSADALSHAVSADDSLPLIVLMLLKLKPAEVGRLFVEMCFISDTMADFLSSGCHSYALTEFQMAFRILSQTCDELDIKVD